jgi:hypothetical protein
MGEQTKSADKRMEVKTVARNKGLAGTSAKTKKAA